MYTNATACAHKRYRLSAQTLLSVCTNAVGLSAQTLLSECPDAVDLVLGTVVFASGYGQIRV
ncbi:MAG: hypothetical protein K8963_02360 [Proteobacteria bacterium]|nr:hypothetical protein [Pseudomonadota bacterium]